MTNVVLTLGDFTFKDTEVPEDIKVSTEHRMNIHKMIGGVRIIDMLGPDHQPISWSGWLVGANALNRAITLKQMSDAGVPLNLSWSEFYYQVVIASVEVDFEREYQFEYRITLVVLQDLTAPVYQDSSAGLDDLIGGDMKTANSLSSSIGDSKLTGSMSSLSASVASVSSFATASKSTINGVLVPLKAAQQQCQTLIASTENTLQSVTTLGGILPNNPLSQQIGKFNNVVNAMTNQPNLIQLSSVLSRMGTNMAAPSSAVKSIQVAGGSLFDLASKFYGNVSAWTGLAQANPQLKNDPTIVGPQTIAIPKQYQDSGGILSA